MLWQPGDHEPLTSAAWDEDGAHRAIEAIVEDAWAAAPKDCLWRVHPQDVETEEDALTSLYIGSAGMVWALHQLGCPLDLAGIAGGALARYRAEPDFGTKAHAPSLWMGEVGLILVMLKLGAEVADLERLSALVLENREHDTWELMWGSPGTTIAARVSGLKEEWRDSAQLLWERWDEQSDLWTQSLYGQVTQNPRAGARVRRQRPRPARVRRGRRVERAGGTGPQRDRDPRGWPRQLATCDQQARGF